MTNLSLKRILQQYLSLKFNPKTNTTILQTNTTKKKHKFTPKPYVCEILIVGGLLKKVTRNLFKISLNYCVQIFFIYTQEIFYIEIETYLLEAQCRISISAKFTPHTVWGKIIQHVDEFSKFYISRLHTITKYGPHINNSAKGLNI